MKFYWTLSVILVLSSGIPAAQAQQQPEPETHQSLLQAPIKFSGFGGPIYEYSAVSGDFNVATGGGGALLINQQLFIGAYGLRSNNHSSLLVEGIQYDRVRVDFDHGGLWVGYIHESSRLIHYGISAKIAGGNIRLVDERERGRGNSYQIARDGVFVSTPQAEVELNVLKWMKLNAGLGYRIVAGVETAPLKNADFNSLQGTFTIMFGWFDQ